MEDKDSVELVGDLDEEISRLIKCQQESETVGLYSASSAVPGVRNKVEVKPGPESKWTYATCYFSCDSREDCR